MTTDTIETISLDAMTRVTGGLFGKPGNGAFDPLPQPTRVFVDHRHGGRPTPVIDFRHGGRPAQGPGIPQG